MRKHKYGAKPEVVDGEKFPSKKEARRAQDLKLLEKAGEIQGLIFHPRFSLIVNEIKICDYIADSTYKIPATNETIVEDVKGFKTREYRLKKKLMRAVRGVEIREV